LRLSARSAASARCSPLLDALDERVDHRRLHLLAQLLARGQCCADLVRRHDALGHVCDCAPSRRARQSDGLPTRPHGCAGDSGKVWARTYAPGAEPGPEDAFLMGRPEENLAYFDGERDL
jgi:hypothetical protein